MDRVISITFCAGPKVFPGFHLVTVEGFTSKEKTRSAALGERRIQRWRDDSDSRLGLLSGFRERDDYRLAVNCPTNP